jgi:hypothetical protein
MLAVTCPESEVMNRCRGGNQRVTELYVVASGELAKVIPGTTANFRVDRNAGYGSKQRVEHRIFWRAGSVPNLRDGYR